MLEILFLRWFYRHLADVAEAKGRTPLWGFVGVAVWIIGEVLGFAIAFAGGGGELGGYGLALGFAALSAALAYGAVRALPDLTIVETGPLQF